MEDVKAAGLRPLNLGASRRDLLRGLAALGVGVGLGPRAAWAQVFDWKKYAGTKLGLLMTGDENDHRALADLMPEFLEQTGIELEVTSPALGALIEKTLQNLQTPQSSFELIM